MAQCVDICSWSSGKYQTGFVYVLILSMYLGSKVSLNTFSLLNSMTHDVHNIIQGMEKEILPKYFRHSNYSSFVSIMEVIYLTVSNLKCRYIFSFQSLYLTVNFSFTNVWISIKHQTYFFFFFTATSNELLRLPENSWKRQDVSLLIRQWECQERYIQSPLHQA